MCFFIPIIFMELHTNSHILSTKNQFTTCMNGNPTDNRMFRILNSSGKHRQNEKEQNIIEPSWVCRKALVKDKYINKLILKSIYSNSKLKIGILVRDRYILIYIHTHTYHPRIHNSKWCSRFTILNNKNGFITIRNNALYFDTRSLKL